MTKDLLLNQPVFQEPSGTSYAERRDALIQYYADRAPEGYYPHIGLIEVAARLFLKRPFASVEADLHRLLADPHGDMFWMYPMVLTHYAGQQVLPDAVQHQMRALWRTYTPYRGDTENHWLLYYASLYLICQAYPDDPAHTWFNGRSARENKDEAEAYIAHWITLTTTQGQGEYDSPHYLPFFLAPLALLYGFAKDSTMRQRAQMMLDYLIADFAVDTLHGLFVGAFSRVYPEPALTRWKNGSTSFAWLLFGNTPFRPDAVNVVLPRIGYRPHATAAILAMSGYEPPPVLVALANKRDQPYIHRERKRTRHRIRYSTQRNVPVYKYTRMHSAYALGSTQGRLLQPIQQHTWELLWATDDPHEGYNVLFTIHPYASAYELGMYFPEEPKLLAETVAQHEKNTYNRGDKWTGASPYEQVFQHEDALIALYSLPADIRFPYIRGYFSRTLRHVVEDESGWLFAQGGHVFIAYYPLAPFVWQDGSGGDRRLHSPHRQNGAVVHVAPASDFADFARFREAICVLPLTVSTKPVPHVQFTTLNGDQLAMTYGETPEVNQHPVDYANWPLFDGPHLQSSGTDQVLTMQQGAMRRVLDFKTLTIHDAQP